MVGSSYRLSIPNALIIGGLKQPPRLRQLRNGAVFLYGAATPPSRRRGIRVSQPFSQFA